MSALLGLFDDKLKSQRDTAACSPQTLATITLDPNDQTRLVRAVRRLNEVNPRIDYGDFKNFVFFNSALDYFSITGEKILNEYPFDGTDNDVDAFYDDLDQYQRHVLSQWPRNSGHIEIRPSISASYVAVDDIGIVSGSHRTQLLTPGTGSWSMEMWLSAGMVTGTITGSLYAAPIISLLSADSFMGYQLGVLGNSGTLAAYATFFSGSQKTFSYTEIARGQEAYICASYDQATSVISLYTGSESSFPIYTTGSDNIKPAGAPLGAIFVSGSEKLLIGSGTVAPWLITQGTVPASFSGSIGTTRLWNVIRGISDISSSFNVTQRQRAGLVACWDFSETGSIPNNDHDNVVVIDYSGHRINGTLKNYWPGVRASGSLLPFDLGDLVLSLKNPEVSSFVVQQQSTGSTYDRTNDNIITRLLPQNFFDIEDGRSLMVLENFLYVLAREFDQIKVSIDQFVNVLKADYGVFGDGTPDALLKDAAEFMGWKFTGNFLNSSVIEYMLGKNVLPNLGSNADLDTKLYEIKNEFWRRMLVNMMHIYKTKGTRESVDALLNVYGIVGNFVHLKEYGRKPLAGITTNRIVEEKSVPALTINSGPMSGSELNQQTQMYVSSSIWPCIEMRVRFPTLTSENMTCSAASGTVLSLQFQGPFLSSSSLGPSASVLYAKPSIGSTTGSLMLSSSYNGNLLRIDDLPIFDGGWYNLLLNTPQIDRNVTDLKVAWKNFNDDLMLLSSSFVFSGPGSNASALASAYVGSSGSASYGDSQLWLQELRLWNMQPYTSGSTLQISDSELTDHTLNFQSYGRDDPFNNSYLVGHWRLNDDKTTNVSGSITFVEISQNVSASSLTGVNLLPSSNPFERFLFDYSFIAPPDYGWNEDKIRSFASVEVPEGDAYADDYDLALEFNMVDALNEDISQLFSSVDPFNFSVGLPVNRYRDSYVEIDSLRAIYFKRLQGRLNFRIFSDMLQFFDRSFVDMVEKLIPARAIWRGEEFVVQSHMLERPKHQWPYIVHPPPFQPSGSILVFSRVPGDGGVFQFYSSPSSPSSPDVVNVGMRPSEDSSVSGVIRYRRFPLSLTFGLPTIVESDRYLLEDGSGNLLTEDGFYILQE